jgi:alpha-glucosidase
VRLWLWVHWTDLERFEPCAEVFQRFRDWGIAGVKIDFMDRDDQEMVQWYERVVSTGADYGLMINFHGAYKPTGLERTYPNYATREGVLGNEYNKWSTRVTPEHKVTLPFTRVLCGAADFTPGGFLNRQPEQFRPGIPTQVQGTRAAELALFVIYESPITCVCDHPDHYRDQPGSEFLKHVPTAWNETCVLAADVANYIIVARETKAGVTRSAFAYHPEWYMAGLTDADEREVEVSLDFLPSPGPQARWQMQLYRDGPVSDEDAEVVELEERFVTPEETLKLRMAPSGGFAARIRQVRR